MKPSRFSGPQTLDAASVSLTVLSTACVWHDNLGKKKLVTKALFDNTLEIVWRKMSHERGLSYVHFCPINYIHIVGCVEVNLRDSEDPHTPSLFQVCWFTCYDAAASKFTNIE